VEDLLKLDELSLEVATGWWRWSIKIRRQLLARVKALRQNLAQQLGFIVPPIHITDNVRLKPKNIPSHCAGRRWRAGTSPGQSAGHQFGRLAAPAGGVATRSRPSARPRVDSGGVAESGAGVGLRGGGSDLGSATHLAE